MSDYAGYYEEDTTGEWMPPDQQKFVDGVLRMIEYGRQCEEENQMRIERERAAMKATAEHVDAWLRGKA